jgi:glycosyltransferase involved in cell wall biosynthesis
VFSASDFDLQVPVSPPTVFKPCAIVPAYRHVERLGEIATRLRAAGLPVFIVDDGNDAPLRDRIAALHDPERGLRVVHRAANGGKGAAMKSGFAAAIGEGFSHALQVDADGQHDLDDAPVFIARARDNPAAVICGAAIYDSSVPKGRQYGRWITHFWVWIETFSFDIADSMCGFRLYPLAAASRVVTREHVGDRMDFDTEILVHLHWRGNRVINQATRVIYPDGNVSNFHMLRDNVRISLMHTRLALQGPFRVAARLLRNALGFKEQPE